MVSCYTWLCGGNFVIIKSIYMKRKFSFLLNLVLLVSLLSCSSTQTKVLPPSVTSSGPRTIILDGETVSEVDVLGFTSWYCQDYINGDQTLVEVGLFGKTNYDELGFILFDNGFTGETTHYQRKGLEHNWYWGPNNSDYQFTVKTDGTGVYYDFSQVPEGEKTKPSSIYKCYKR